MKSFTFLFIIFLSGCKVYKPPQALTYLSVCNAEIADSIAESRMKLSKEPLSNYWILNDSTIDTTCYFVSYERKSLVPHTGGGTEYWITKKGCILIHEWAGQ